MIAYLKNFLNRKKLLKLGIILLNKCFKIIKYLLFTICLMKDLNRNILMFFFKVLLLQKNMIL